MSHDHDRHGLPWHGELSAKAELKTINKAQAFFAEGGTAPMSQLLSLWAPAKFERRFRCPDSKLCWALPGEDVPA